MLHKISSLVLYFQIMTEAISLAWSQLDRKDSLLPTSLHPHQLDSFYWLEQGKHVLLCVGTGKSLNSQRIKVPRLRLGSFITL